MQEPYYTADEVARILHKHVVNVRRLCREGAFEGARKFGRDWYIPKTTIDPPAPQQKSSTPRGRDRPHEQPF